MTTMTIQEILNNLEQFDTKMRKWWLTALVENLSIISAETLNQFQLGWDNSRPWSEYLAAQNSVIRSCVQWETSAQGDAFRQSCGLILISPNTQIRLE